MARERGSSSYDLQIHCSFLWNSTQFLSGWCNITELCTVIYWPQFLVSLIQHGWAMNNLH